EEDSIPKKACDGDLALVKVNHGHHITQSSAEIIKVIGPSSDPNNLSWIAIHESGIPHEFSAEAITLAKKAKVPDLGQRQDLRQIPLITIDGEDARDFDDAVWAESDPKNKGAWHAIVAIADVAHYVQEDD